MGLNKRVASISSFLVCISIIILPVKGADLHENGLPADLHENGLPHQSLRKRGDESSRLSMLRELLNSRYDQMDAFKNNAGQQQERGVDNMQESTRMSDSRRHLVARDGRMYSFGVDVTVEEDGKATLEFVRNLGLTTTIPEPTFPEPKQPLLSSSEHLLSQRDQHETAHRETRLLPKKLIELARTPGKGGKGKGSKSKSDGKGKGGKGDMHYYDYSYDYDYDYHHHHPHGEHHYDYHYDYDYDYYKEHHSNENHHHHSEEQHHHHSTSGDHVHDDDYVYNEHHDHEHHDDHHENDINESVKQFTLLVRKKLDEDGTTPNSNSIYSEQIEVDLFNTSGRNVGAGYFSCFFIDDNGGDKTGDKLCNVSFELNNNGAKVAQLELSFMFRELDSTHTTFGITGGSGKFSGAQGSGYFEQRYLNVPNGCTVSDSGGPSTCVSQIWYVTIYEYYDKPYPSMDIACTFC